MMALMQRLNGLPTGFESSGARGTGSLERGRGPEIKGLWGKGRGKHSTASSTPTLRASWD